MFVLVELHDFHNPKEQLHFIHVFVYSLILLTSLGLCRPNFSSISTSIE